MADKSSIIVESTNHVTGKKQQLTLTNINPQASSTNLATWGQMTAALTKDAYSKTTRIDRIECDTTKTQRTLTAFTATSNINFTLDEGTYKADVPVSRVVGTPPSFTINVTEPTLGNPTRQCCLMTNIDFPTGWRLFSNRQEFTSNRNAFYVIADTTPTAGPVLKATIIIPEDATYKELRLPFEITIVADEGSEG